MCLLYSDTIIKITIKTKAYVKFECVIVSKDTKQIA